MMRASRTFFRFFGYSMLLIILYVFQGSGFIIPEIFGGRPLMLISLALCIASFENTLPSVIFGALCGVLTDISFDGSILPLHLRLSAMRKTLYSANILYRHLLPLSCFHLRGDDGNVDLLSAVRLDCRA